MKWFLGLFGLIVSAWLVSIAAQFGYKLGTNDYDAYQWAFGYGAITLASIGSFTVAVHVWRRRKYAWWAAAIVLGLICTPISLSNGLGSLAGRINKAQAERITLNKKIKTDDDLLKDMKEERKALRGVPYADADSVAAATLAVSTAGTARYNACKTGRGPDCLAKEADESAALKAKTDAISNKGKTERAAKLDVDIPAQQAKVDANGAELEANVQGTAIAKLFNLDKPETKADLIMAGQNFSIAALLELIAAFCLGLFESLVEHEKAPRGAALAVRQDITPVPLKPVRQATRAIQAPRNQGDVSIVADILNRAHGRVEIADTYMAYVNECEVRGLTPMPRNEFPAALTKLCQKMNIQIEVDEDRVYLVGVQLKALELEDAS
jgi:hypothetical protein